MPKLLQHSLHAKLILAFVLVLLIPTVVISAYSQWRTRETLLRQLAGEHLALARARADTAESAIARGSADLLFAAQAPPMRRFARAEPGALVNVGLHFRGFLRDTAGRYSGLCLLDRLGRELVCVRDAGDGPAPVAAGALGSRHSQPYFVNALQRAGIPGDERVEITAVDRLGPRGPLIRYSTVIESEDGLVAAVVVLEALAAPVFDLLLDVDPRVRTSLVEPDGRYLIYAGQQAGAEHPSLGAEMPVDAAPILRQPEGTLIHAVDRPGALLVFKRVRPAGQSALQWTVIYERPLASLLDDVSAIGAVNLAITAAALLAALAAATLLARGILRPVKALAAAADRVGAGDLHTSIPHSGADEIAALGTTLERTMVRLREAIEAAERRRQEAETLSAATRALSSTLSLGRVLELILSELRKVVPYDSASVQMVEGDSVVIIGAYGLVNAETLIGSRFSLVSGASPNAEVARSRAPVLLTDAPASYPIFKADLYRHDPIQSWLGVPLLFGDRLIGMITLDKHGPAFYNESYARLALDFAAQAAIAMENARLYEAARTELMERRRAEAANSRLATILEATTDLVAVCDLEGNALFLNAAARRILDVDPDAELTHANACDFYAPEALVQLNEVGMPAALRDGVWSGETTLIDSQGRVFPASQVILTHYHPDGTPEYMSTIIRDISERRRAEAELRQAQKMEALGRLAGGLAHDFNNLLTVILGECDLLLSDLPAADPSHGSAEQIRQSGMRAAALTKQLLAFSRRQVLQPELVDLNEVITGMEQLLRRLIGEDIVLAIDLAHNLPTVRADPGQIEQVVLNLAINARDAMPEGGRMLIETTAAAIGADQGLHHPEIGDGLYALIAVSDTGVGIDEAVRAHIFEPFFTTKPRGKGTGLGLATVHGIVRQSGGHIWFSSEPGHGSSFRVYLPAAAGAAAAPPPAQPPQVRGRMATETVLLVEDDEHVRTLARTILARAGFTVLEAGDGRAAIELMRAYRGELHALLTDVVMPGGFNGVQVAAVVRAERPATRIVYMSGYTDNVLVGRSLVDDNACYIQKPFTADALVGALHDALAR